MARGEPEHPERDRIELTSVLHALSDPTRLTVVRQIAEDGRRMCGSFDVGVAKSTLSQHLRVLREAGVVRSEARGTQRWLTLRQSELDDLFPGLLDVVLRTG
ncbi:ArsR/SmtB family transcription factor [Allokutzneria oryzae]|uniref:ArsR/SmtB family transcription factor n=1 Tax=Allokutzneria oryzae TaxID=1378989 RepID=A0ABV6A5A2_9PSEU